jgi:predicted nucleic-acid-binding protein
MRAVDTNVLVRLITRDDARQAAAADAFVAPGGWVGHLVLAETTSVLSTVYGLTPAAIATAVDMLLNHQHVTIQDAEVVSAALDNYKQYPRIDFSDCLVVEIARKAGHLPVGTFERQLAKLDGTQTISR